MTEFMDATTFSKQAKKKSAVFWRAVCPALPRTVAVPVMWGGAEWERHNQLITDYAGDART
jgi:hypothetical protein